MQPIHFFTSRPADLTCVIMTNADVDTLAAIIPVYFRLGARKLHIYYDGMMPQQWASRFHSHAGLSFFNIPECFKNVHFPTIVDKQCAVYNRAYATCETRWLAVCDCDEFIVADEPLADFLEKIPDDRLYIHCQSHETLWQQTDDPELPFSASLARMDLPGVLGYGEFAAAFADIATFMKAGGLVSHTEGKYLIRTGFDVALEVHGAKPDDRIVPGTHALPLRLVHYDAVSFPSWHEKLTNKLAKQQFGGQSRRTQLEYFAGASNTQRRQMFEQFYIPSASQLDLLDRLNGLFALPRRWTVRFFGMNLPVGGPIFPRRAVQLVERARRLARRIRKAFSA